MTFKSYLIVTSVTGGGDLTVINANRYKTISALKKYTKRLFNSISADLIGKSSQCNVLRNHYFLLP